MPPDLRLVVSILANKNLRSIERYTVEKWGIPQAQRYIAALRATAMALANKTTKGRPAGLSRPTIQRVLTGKHHLYYEELGTDLLLSRVLHGSMSVERKVFPRLKPEEPQ